MKKNVTIPVFDKIEKAASDYGLFEGCEKILVGLSGGADSTCLLLALKGLSQKYGFEVYALHINHMIRGSEADRDELFAKELCEKNGVHFLCERIDVPAISKEKGLSLELCARDERYLTFRTTCKEYGISHVATAHNSKDNAETVLFNMIRGSAAKGLCGIPAKRNLDDGITLIRPLIYVSREEIEKYLCDIGQDFVTDSTNLSCDYTRNLIRNRVLPLLSEINPNLEESILRMGSLLRKDEEYLSSITRENDTDELEKLCLLDECILSRVIRLMFAKVSCEMPEEKHVSALCAKIYSYSENRHLKCRISFPDKTQAVIAKGKLYFEKICEKKGVLPYCAELSKGLNVLDGSYYLLYISYDENEVIDEVQKFNDTVYRKIETYYLYSDVLPEKLYARTRLGGDKIHLSGMNKSLKRLMNEKEICENIRFSLPIICEKDEVICVPYIGCCDGYRKSVGKSFSFSVSIYKRDF